MRNNATHHRGVLLRRAMSSFADYDSSSTLSLKTSTRLWNKSKCAWKRYSQPSLQRKRLKWFFRQKSDECSQNPVQVDFRNPTPPLSLQVRFDAVGRDRATQQDAVSDRAFTSSHLSRVLLNHTPSTHFFLIEKPVRRKLGPCGTLSRNFIYHLPSSKNNYLHTG